MGKHPTWLLDFAANVYSQAGEDGVISKILELLPERDRWCVEFGAWDGVHLSNTADQIRNHAYSAVLIEGDAGKYEALVKNYAGNSKVLTRRQFVGFTSHDNLDHVLQDTPVPIDFDFLSIDIDGNDYHAWEAISRYSPKLLCIEFNPTIPNEVKFIQSADPCVNHGSSLSAIVELGKRKNYELVAVLPSNALFVKSEYFELFQIEDNRPEVMRIDLNAVTYIFSGYDGTLFLAGSRRLPWHQLELRENELQPLPVFLRKYPLDYSRLEALAFELYTKPGRFFRNLPGRVGRALR